MSFGGGRGEMREVFFRAWCAFRQEHPLTGIEKIAVEIALRHPEYHSVLENPQSFQDRDYLPDFGETNPFLHMGLHIAIEEQITTNRPPGVIDIYQALRERFDDSHMVEHQMMDCLAEALWQAQRHGGQPSEKDYLACLRRQADSE
ncbi:MAG: DUF1841 family protein [Gammaproteobacteria bacterium]|nr:DUF1841 family protein [Gammaproteobacteria bacterium]